MSFTYTTDIPDGPNNPSNDQPDMKINTNSIDSIIAVDHVGFNTAKGGFHKQVKFSANQSAPGFGTGVGDIYANTAVGNSWPFWQNALGSTQLAGPTSTSASNGSTYLPGGIILKWGFVNSITNGTVTFTTAFPNNIFAVMTTAYYSGSASGVGATTLRKSQVLVTGFEWTFNTNASNYTGFNWIAVGN